MGLCAHFERESLNICCREKCL